MKPEGNKKLTRREYREENIDGSKIKLNFWNIWADRPYVTVTIIVLAVLCIMTGYWLGLVALIIITAIGVITIGHSHHPNRVLSIGFYLKSSRLLSALKAMQLGASIIMFLATYMRRVVSVDFSAAGTQDSLQIIQGLLSNTGRYGQQGSYFIGLLNTLTGGSLLGSYRYATNTSQMMSDSAGLMIISWILLLMIAPAICVLSEFFREPYSRNTSLIASIVSTVSFILTPYVMKSLVIQYAAEHQTGAAIATQAVSFGSMAYVAMACSVIVLGIAIYRVVNKTN